jgi:hypothetical protein
MLVSGPVWTGGLPHLVDALMLYGVKAGTDTTAKLFMGDRGGVTCQPTIEEVETMTEITSAYDWRGRVVIDENGRRSARSRSGAAYGQTDAGRHTV